MLNNLNILEEQINTAAELCDSAGPLLRIVGIVVLGIQIVVPILLIITGMIKLATAVSEKEEGKIKEAQKALISKAIAAVLVFLVVFFVKIIMGIIGNNQYEACMDCINEPFSNKCKTN